MGAEQSGQPMSRDEMDAMTAAERKHGSVPGSVRQRRGSAFFLNAVTVHEGREFETKELIAANGSLNGQSQNLIRHMDTLKQGAMAGYIREYTTIAEGRDATAFASMLEPHKRLNRYNNIVAYDHSRVKLKPNVNTYNSDYINANWVEAYNRPKGYICTQGPVPASQPAFWQMVWENKVEVIVMVTNEVEGGKMKCHRYWADSPAEVQQGGQNPKTFGGFTVTHTSEEVLPNYITRTFDLKDHKSGKTRKISHFLYTAWPDHGVPDTATELLSFRHTVKQLYNPENPMLVHCSAGVGRTGTFVGLDRYLDATVELNTDLTVLEVVRNMRASRNFMVQAQAQFIYLYEACLEGLRKLEEKCAREIALRGKDDHAKQQQLLAEIEAELGHQNSAFTTRVLGAKLGRQIKPDFPKEHDGLGLKYTDDIQTTQKVSGGIRKESLASATTAWVKRANVPMSRDEHGYNSDRSAPLTARLMALSEARSAWLGRYAEAERTWAAEHDLEGVVYEIGTQLTPLESRVASLATSDEAWKLRMGNTVSLEDERLRQKMHDLTVRLESLQHGVLNSDRRWRAKGDGFSGNNIEVDDTAGVHTTDAFGGLTERLQLLSENQTAYMQREAWEPYEIQKFHDSIIGVAEEQEAISEKRMAELKAEEDARAHSAAELANEKAVAAAKVKAVKDEKARREKIKKKMADKSKFQGSYDHPALVAKKAAEEDAKMQAALAKQMDELRMAEEAKEKALGVSQKKTKAQKDSAKFLQKMK